MTEKKLTEEVVEEGVHNYSAADAYVWPADPKVRQKLEWFQDQKLALMMHWGPYSQLGIVEPGPVGRDAEWSRKGIDWEASGKEFKEQYFGLNRTFNPIRFDPERWADLAEEAGIRYLLFTTKHHDGFCMWDSRYSDYKSRRRTARSIPISMRISAGIYLKPSVKRNRNRSLFFQGRLACGQLLEKRAARGVTICGGGPSYDPAARPEEWEMFLCVYAESDQRTGSQVRKNWISCGFCAGWVCPQSGQDIRLGEVIDEIRSWQPGMLCADRTVGGPYENYITPGAVCA